MFPCRVTQYYQVAPRMFELAIHEAKGLTYWQLLVSATEFGVLAWLLPHVNH